MALIEWNDSLKIGIGIIDNQHKQLVKLTNELNDAMKSGKAKTVLSGIIASLAQYTVTHFTAEEQYLISSPIPAKPPTRNCTLSSWPRCPTFRKTSMKGRSPFP